MAASVFKLPRLAFTELRGPSGEACFTTRTFILFN